MQLAEASVVQKKKAVAALQDENDNNNDDHDLTLAESCHTWRDLYHTLLDRNDQVRNSQGQRMREIRKNVCSVASSFPLVVVVVPAP
jgi:superfamily I DNA and RNA helicase